MVDGPVLARRLAIAGLCVLSLVVCCGLAWWQWERYSSAGGTFQNLGYVLQWPLFGLFPAFMVWRIRRFAKRSAAHPEPERPALETTGGPPASPGIPGPRPVARTGHLAPDDEDEGDEQLAEYNRYLAELNARDQHGR